MSAELDGIEAKLDKNLRWITVAMWVAFGDALFMFALFVLYVVWAVTHA